MTYNPVCEQCHMRPKMDRCDICEECWYAPRPVGLSENLALLPGGYFADLLAGDESGRKDS